MLVLCLSAVYLIWGTSYLATRIGVLHLPPLLFGGARFLIAARCSPASPSGAASGPRSSQASGITCW